MGNIANTATSVISFIYHGYNCNLPRVPDLSGGLGIIIFSSPEISGMQGSEGVNTYHKIITGQC